MFAGVPHDRSFALFEHPEEFPGLPPYAPEQRVLRVWICPSFGPWASWSVYRIGDDRLVRRVILERRTVAATLQPWAADAYVPPTAIEALRSELGSLAIPSPTDVPKGGIDGVTLGFETEAATLVWWGTPAACDSLAAWHDRTRALLDGYLPAHRTDPE